MRLSESAKVCQHAMAERQDDISSQFLQKRSVYALLLSEIFVVY